MIKIDFEVETEYGIYKDALTLPEDHTLTEEDIENLKKERVDNWLFIINQPTIENNSTSTDYIEIDGVKYIKAEV